MTVSTKLRHLISAAGPLWAGEAEIVRTYWDCAIRTLETDLLWLRRQCSKEFYGSGIGEFKDKGVFLGPVMQLLEMFPKIDAEIDRHDALEVIDMLHDEYRHFVLLADVHDAIKGAGTPPLNAQTLVTWPEDQKLTALRLGHNKTHGVLGVRASRFTEGGYCTLFREAMRIEGRGGADALIARACIKIHDDEFGHMLTGIVGLDQEGLAADAWALLEELVTDQLRHRILMRNAQFGFPLPTERIDLWSFLCHYL